jgi:hypothetical protein
MGEHQDFVKTTGIGTITGLMGINCRHSIFPATQETKPIEVKPRFVTINGRPQSIYKCEQKQRVLERQLRNLKRRLKIAEALNIGDEITLANSGITATKARLRTLCKVAGLHRDSLAEQI